MTEKRTRRIHLMEEYAESKRKKSKNRIVRKSRNKRVQNKCRRERALIVCQKTKAAQKIW